MRVLKQFGFHALHSDLCENPLKFLAQYFRSSIAFEARRLTLQRCGRTTVSIFVPDYFQDGSRNFIKFNTNTNLLQISRRDSRNPLSWSCWQLSGGADSPPVETPSIFQFGDWRMGSPTTRRWGHLMSSLLSKYLLKSNEKTALCRIPANDLTHPRH